MTREEIGKEGEEKTKARCGEGMGGWGGGANHRGTQ